MLFRSLWEKHGFRRVYFDAASLYGLETRRYQQQVDEEIAMVQEIGVSAVPTFIFNNEYAIVGAETYPAFQHMMEHLGYPPPEGSEAPPDTYHLSFDAPTRD